MIVSYWTNESKGTELGSIGLPSVGGSASPFIDDGDGFTGERERVRMFFSLVAHADGYKIIVGAYKLLMSLLNVRCIREVVLPFSGMVDVGTCKYCSMPRVM